MFNVIKLWDISVLEKIQEIFKCVFLDKVMPIITLFGEGGIFWIILAVVLLCFRKTRKIGFSLGCALLLGVLFGNSILKPLVGRVRPYDLAGYEFIRDSLLVKPLSDFSFPSGHTLACFEAATVLMMRDKRIGIPALVIAVLVAFSRLYLFVHYPTDVITGMLLGILFGILGCIIVDACYKKFVKKEQPAVK